MFEGHNQYLQKKLGQLKSKLHLEEQKRPNCNLSSDFHEIDSYRCVLNAKVFESIQMGIF